MLAPYVYRVHVDQPPTADDFRTMGERLKPSMKALVGLEKNIPYCRYTNGRHSSFANILQATELDSAIELHKNREVAERWVESVDHESIDHLPIEFRGAEFQEIVLADVVSAVAEYRFEVAAEPLVFRLQVFLLPTDIRFDLMRILALGSPDVLDRSELSSAHLELVCEAENWTW